MATLAQGMVSAGKVYELTVVTQQKGFARQAAPVGCCPIPRHQRPIQSGTSAFLSNTLVNAGRRKHCREGTAKRVQRECVCMSLIGEDPEWLDDDYIAVGLAHCFSKDEGKLQDEFVVEPIPAGALECMDNGGVTSYKHVAGTTVGVALKQDLSLFPSEFAGSKFCEDFAFRTKCASRTWKRDHAQEFLLKLVPVGALRSDFNFSLEDKRVLNMEYEVNDADNIKQDMSIDVYGRAGEEEAPAEANKEIEKLYNA